MNPSEPDPEAPYFNRYIALVNEANPIEAMHSTLDEMHDLLRDLTEEDCAKPYAEGKWTIKDILIHLIDSERIFCSRALAFARGDNTILPGFDHEKYVDEAKANDRPMEELVNEMELVRSATIALFQSFNQEQLNRKGVANELEQTAATVARIIPGHHRYHNNIIKERYIPF